MILFHSTFHSATDTYVILRLSYYDSTPRCRRRFGSASRRLNLPPTPESTSRSQLFNWFLAIPHYIVLAVFGIGAGVVAIIGWFAVLFTGRWPAGGRRFLVRVANYYPRVWTYVAMVEPSYPSFSLPS